VLADRCQRPNEAAEGLLESVDLRSQDVMDFRREPRAGGRIHFLPCDRVAPNLIDGKSFPQ
jgi:hypothetical protein